MTHPEDARLAGQIMEFRRFNRFYTVYLGLLADGILGCGVTLAEGRLLDEVAQRPGCRAADIAARLAMDRAQVSRILSRLQDRGFVITAKSASDGRAKALFSTPSGDKTLRRLHARATDQAGAILSQLPPRERERLLEAMEYITATLSAEERG